MQTAVGSEWVGIVPYLIMDKGNKHVLRNYLNTSHGITFHKKHRLEQNKLVLFLICKILTIIIHNFG